MLSLSAGCERPDVAETLAGVSAERENRLAAGETHRYSVDLEAGEYLHVAVEQRGVDLSVDLLDPDGNRLLRVDSPNGSRGQEQVWAIAALTGTYRLELGTGHGSGPYTIRNLARRPAQAPRDVAYANAARALAEGERLRREKKAEAALAQLGKARELWRGLGEPRQEAIALTFSAQTWIELGDLQRAIRSYEEARGILRDDLGDRSLQSVALLNWLGAVRIRNSELPAAFAAFTEALDVVREIDAPLGRATTLTNMALVLDLRGRSQEAFAHHQEALPLWRELGDGRRSARALVSMGYHYLLLGQLDEARTLLEEAEVFAREAGSQREQARALLHLGWIFYLRKQLTPALDSYARALELSEATGDLSNKAGVLDRQGAVYLELDRLAQARACFEESLAIFDRLGDVIAAAHVRSNLSHVHTLLGDFERALQYFEQAMAQFEGSGHGHGEASALFIGAEAERRSGNLDRARSYLERALAIVESNRSATVNQDWRISYFGALYRYHESYIDLLMELSARRSAPEYAELALSVAERARARSLLDMLQEADAEIRHQVDETLLRRERGLRERLNAKDFERFQAQRNGRSPELLVRLDRELQELTREQHELQAEIRMASPAYAALTPLLPVGLRQVQRELLDEETLLLVYALGRERSFLWAVGSDWVDSYELADRAAIEVAAQELYKQLRKSSRRGSGRRARLAAALSEMVLEPVADRLRRRLLIVADGALQYIPFAALPSPVCAEKYLVTDHEIVYLPSASVLAALRREDPQRPPPTGLIAILADPVFSAEDPRSLPRTPSGADPAAATALADARRSARDLGLADLPRLLHSRREAEAIAALARPGATLVALGFEARRDLVTSAELGRYRFVHFATHGLLHAQHPELTGIVLSMIDERGRTIDGFLRAHEVYELRLSADLVVLSACRTALGPQIRGEGLLGLTRGFMYAGASRVMVSLWNVSDRATAELMERFYRGVLVDGQPPARALHEAQKSMLDHERWQAPAYWAGFVLQGEWK